MVTKFQKAIIAIFIITAIVLLVVVTFILGGMKFLEKRVHYFVEFQNISIAGMAVGSPVRYNGVNVGQVEDIRLDKNDPNIVIVDLALREGTPVKSNTKATISMLGITGLKYIELDGGSKSAKILEPNSKIEPGSSLVSEITDKTTVIMTKVEAAVDGISEALSPEVIHDFKTSLSNLAEITKNTAEILDTNKEDIKIILKSARNISEDIERFTAKLDSISQNIDEERVLNLISSAEKLVSEIRQTVKRVDLVVLNGRNDLLRLLKKLKETSEHLSQFSRAISEDPSILLRKQSINE